MWPCKLYQFKQVTKKSNSSRPSRTMAQVMSPNSSMMSPNSSMMSPGMGGNIGGNLGDPGSNMTSPNSGNIMGPQASMVGNGGGPGSNMTSPSMVGQGYSGMVANTMSPGSQSMPGNNVRMSPPQGAMQVQPQIAMQSMQQQQPQQRQMMAAPSQQMAPQYTEQMVQPPPKIEMRTVQRSRPKTIMTDQVNLCLALQGTKNCSCLQLLTSADAGHKKRKIMLFIGKPIGRS